MYWKFLTSLNKQTFHPNTSKGKVMLEVFFNNRTLHQEYITQGHTVNKTIYRGFLRRLTEATLLMPAVLVSRKMGSTP